MAYSGRRYIYTALDLENSDDSENYDRFWRSVQILKPCKVLIENVITVIYLLINGIGSAMSLARQKSSPVSFADTEPGIEK